MLTSGKVDRNILSFFDDQKRIVARLMAQENISVVIIDGVPTASFDTINRVLTLPNWPFINVDQLDTQIGHEIGHALYTDNAFLENFAQRIQAAKEKRKSLGRKLTREEIFEVMKTGLFTYINVVEDTRIERKMREVYPGMTRVFYNGRKAFAENGPVFQVAAPKHILIDKTKVAVASLPFIDRINLFYKIGAFIEIPFSKDEQAWFPVIDKCFSTENAVQIAEKLYELAKEQEKKRQQDKQEQQQRRQAQKQERQKSDPKQQKSQAGEPGFDEDEESGDSGEEKKSNKASKKDDKENEKKSASKKKSDAESDEESDEKSDDSSDNSEEESDDDSTSSADSQDGEEDEESDGKSDNKSGDSEVDDEEDSDDTDSGSLDSAGSDKGKSSDREEDDAEEGADDAAAAPLATGGKSDGELPEPVSKTDQALTEMLQKLAEQQKSSAVQIRNVIIKPVDDTTVKRRTVTAAKWVELCENQLTNTHAYTTADRERLAATLRELEAKWREKYFPTAQHMAQEFQRRKSAKNLQHARTGKTGRLDMNRLSGYKFSEDLFKRVMTVPTGQSHGIVMIIDGSSSMNKVFGQVLDQVLLFAHFAFQCNIPFEAYMFTDRTRDYNDKLEVKSAGLHTITVPNSGRLVGLIDTNTDRRAFKKQVQMVLVLRTGYLSDMTVAGANFDGRSLPYGSLGGTPLFAGMMLMERQVERMKRTLRLDKMMAVVITDGADTAGLTYAKNDIDIYTGNTREAFEVLGQSAFVARDTVTKRNFMFVEKQVGGGYNAPFNAVFTLLFDVMKARHDTRNIALFLLPDNGSHYRATGIQQLTRAGAVVKADPTVRTKSFEQNRQFVLGEDEGVAECSIVLHTDTLQLKENTFAGTNTKGMTTQQISQTFVEATRKAQANRVFVNSVMPYLA